jgi:ATP-dependent protease HslVU (ClpYQ) peptidase subunit
LIAIRGTLFEVDESYTVMLRDDGFYGIGSGSRFALGAMMAGAEWKVAMDLAIKNDIYSHPPYIVMEQFKG